MTNNPKPITSEKEAVSKATLFFDRIVVISRLHPEKDMRGLEEEYKALISNLFQSAYSQGEQAGKAEAINESLAKIAVEVMRVELMKDKDEFLSGHLHGLKRAIYLLKAKYLSGEDKTK